MLMLTRTCLLLLLFVLVIGCRQHIVETGEIKSLTLSSYKQGSVAETAVINDASTIAKLISQVNDARQEPAVFMKEYEISVAYPQRNLTILVRHHFFKIDGVPYRANEDIGERLALLMKK